MRRSNTQPIGDILKEYIREMKMDRKLKETDLIQSWAELMGATIARYTKGIYLSKGILYLEISSSVVRNELMMLREEIRQRLNEIAGEELISKIVFK